MRHKTNKFKRLLTSLAVLGLSIFVSIGANAQTAAESACDPEYYKSLESRAWLEAQREVTQNQNLIFKPDSVLEYTCFDQFLNVLAGEAKNMFSENQKRWGSPVNAEGSMATALNNVVGDSLKSYITKNFQEPKDYPLLGGRAKGVDYKPDSVKAGSYSCDIMNQVWMAAKCMDFASIDDQDGFFTFADYASGDDKRALPKACKAIGEKWTSEEKTVLSDTPWEETDVVTYFDLLDAESCAKLKPVETGLKITQGVDPKEFDEKVCIAPGCSYYPKDKKCCSKYKYNDKGNITGCS